MIIICEPLCRGFEHVEVNAALLAVVHFAFPDEKVLFLAEEEHLERVSKTLLLHSVTGVEFLPVEIPLRLSSFKTVPAELRLCREVFELANKNGVSKVIFSTITSPGLISVKTIIREFKEIKCVVIPHHILETLIERPSFRKPLEIPFWFRFWFFWRNTDRLKYLLLGSSIQKQLTFLFPRIESRIRSIDLPYFYKEPDEYIPKKDNIIRFGSFGVGHRGKGTDLFFKMADEIYHKKTRYQHKFVLIGHINDRGIRDLSSDFVDVPSPDTPLVRKDFDLLARNVDYAIFLYMPTSYRLTASGALFDAFSHLKPVIALRNPFFEYYFETMGDIGYLCDSYDEIKEVVIEILENGVTERYMNQRDNILRGREQINICELAKRFKEIWL